MTPIKYRIRIRQNLSGIELGPVTQYATDTLEDAKSFCNTFVGQYLEWHVAQLNEVTWVASGPIYDCTINKITVPLDAFFMRTD